MPMSNAEAAKHLKQAKNRLANWRRIVFDAVDANSPSQVNREKSAAEIHAAVDSVLATGDNMDLLTLCIVVERMIDDAARDHEAKAQTPIRFKAP